VVEHLPRKQETLSSNHNTTKKKEFLQMAQFSIVALNMYAKQLPGGFVKIDC
jgi:ribose 1,5-bisphosphokinase PhnN